VLSLFKSLDQIESWDGKNIGIWAHSNGGHIALTILEISKINYPTVLWAPVSKPFPYSILYYTNESEDKGKYIRKELAKFEETYDTDAFSLDNYFPDIAAHLQIHQGTADDAVPVEWSKNLYNILRKSYKDQKFNYDLDLFVYPGADHNLQPVWESATARSLSFFKKHLTIKPV
jgi:dipeptidyl aminopeptidase/acylaminoacyl peptidase